MFIVSNWAPFLISPNPFRPCPILLVPVSTYYKRTQYTVRLHRTAVEVRKCFRFLTATSDIFILPDNSLRSTVSTTVPALTSPTPGATFELRKVQRRDRSSDKGHHLDDPQLGAFHVHHLEAAGGLQQEGREEDPCPRGSPRATDAAPYCTTFEATVPDDRRRQWDAVVGSLQQKRRPATTRSYS